MATNEWTDDLKKQVIAAYEEKEPTPENSVEIVKEIANEFNQSANGVRMILVKAGVYVKKTESASTGKASSSSDGSKRVNKAEAIDALKKAIEKAGHEVDDDICDRVTGKAAVYFAKIIG